MNRDKLFKKYSKHPLHTYELSETMSYTDETGRQPDIIFVYSGRNRGKSFEICAQYLADAWYDEKLLAYVRRNDDTQDMIISYFDDKHDFISDMTDGLSDRITIYKSVLYFSHIEEDENGKETVIRDREAGRFFSVSRQGRFKSLQYPKIYRILFEEVLTRDSYLSAEPEKLFDLISTLRRSKEDFRVALISNLVSQINPYSDSWGIHIGRTKPGTVTLTKLYLNAYDDKGNELYYLIAAHYLENRNELTAADQKKNRKRIRTGIASNKWDEAKLYPVMDLKFIKQYDILETVVFEYDDNMFQMDILEVPSNIRDLYKADEDDYIVKPSKDPMFIGYIRRKTSEPWYHTRVYTNNPERVITPYATKGFKLEYKVDRIVAWLKENGWIIGSTNLVMNDFDNIFSKLKLLR